jgi:hypothetical protein
MRLNPGAVRWELTNNVFTQAVKRIGLGKV